jgi:primosomal replication protein N
MRSDELNELTISGYVEQEPVMHKGPDGTCCCELVLTTSSIAPAIRAGCLGSSRSESGASWAKT